MKAICKFFGAILILGYLAEPGAAQAPPSDAVAFPTASAVDGRMLSISSGRGEVLSVTLAVRQTSPALRLWIFDGDTGEASPSGQSHWDAGDCPLSFSLYFDPSGTNNTAAGDRVARWVANADNPTSDPGGDPDRSWTTSVARMPDNAWWEAVVVPSVLARSPGGLLIYHLAVELDPACGTSTISDFKLATNEAMALQSTRISLEASLRSPLATGPIVYFPFDPPNILSSFSTYDGTFELPISVGSRLPELVVRDGDFDHGTGRLETVPSGLTLTPCVDDDDPDTPADYAGWPFTPPGASPEGAAGPGSPGDDSAGDLFRRGEPGSANREGCVRYELISPSGTVYRNDNPSGSGEWEEFRIVAGATAAPGVGGPPRANNGPLFAAAKFDAGIWTLRIVGLDLSNSIYLQVDHPVCGVSGGVAACP